MFEFIYEFRYLLIVIGLYLFYKLGKIRYNLDLKLGHEGPPPLPYIGNFLDVYRYGIRELDKMCLKKYGRIYPFYFGNIKISVVADEELIKQIMVKEAKCFTDKLDLGSHGKTTEKMLIALKGKAWERVRSLVTPTFTSAKIKKMSSFISEGVKLLEERFEKHPVDQPFDANEIFGALTIDVIARAMFGMYIDSQTNPNNLFITHAKSFFNFSFFRPSTAMFYLWPDFAKFIRKFIPRWEMFDRSALKFFMDNLKQAIELRQNSSEEYNDFLSLMLNSHKEVGENESDKMNGFESKLLTNEEIMAQSLLFLLAGYDTTAITLTFLSYYLAKDLQAQGEIYTEILEKIGKQGEITQDTLINMPILDAAINETLRLSSPISRVYRQCTTDITLMTSDNRKIEAKKGDRFAIPIYAIHTDPSLWFNPDIFDLHRFDPENKTKNSLYSFMPFGMGPRGCIGIRLALLEAKWAIVSILKKFEIVPCAETMETIKFKASRFARPTKPIILKFVRRA